MVRRFSAAALVLALAATAAVAAGPAAPDPAVVSALAAKPALPDLAEGRADAPVTIIEYASMTCTHCAHFHKDVWPALKAKYVDTGKAKLVLREFPLDNLAVAAFMLARCAGPEKRNAVVDRLFDHQDEWAFSDNPVQKLKEQLLASGLSAAEFETCLKDQALADKVIAEREAAGNPPLGVDSTPTFFVDGRKMADDHSLAAFDAILAPAAH